VTYTIEIAPAARRQLKKLDRPIQKRIARCLDGLSRDPRPDGVVKLTDVSPPLYRIREGNFRIIYAIEEDRLVVLVVRIAHRSDAYR